MEKINSSNLEKKIDEKTLRQAMQVGSYLNDLNIKALPSTSWQTYYPEKREEILDQVLHGNLEPEKVDINSLKAKGFTYDAREIGNLGLDGLVGKVRDTADFHQHFDYKGYLDFLAGLREKNVELQTATELYESFSKSRRQSELLSSLGPTGQRQVKTSLTDEGKKLLNEIDDKKRIDKILDSLKLRFLKEKGLVKESEFKKTEESLDPNLKQLIDNLSQSYLDYVQKGDKEGKNQLIEQIKNNFEEIKKQKNEDKLDDLIEKILNNPDSLTPEMQEKMDDLFNDYNAPQSDVAPNFQSEMSPSMDETKEGKEGEKVVPLYEVEPPLCGLYQGPIYSTFNKSEVKWGMDVKFQKVISGSARQEHVLSGKINSGGTIPIYLPRNYSIASFNLPANLEIYKDINGTLFLKNNGSKKEEFSLGFGKKTSVNSTPPLAHEKENIAGNTLSLATSNYLKSLMGKSNVEKAKAIVHYMKNILKLKYSNDSKFNRIYKQIPSNYFKKIEKHKQVDCDVAQTYFIALCRSANAASRMVTGHSVDLVQDNKAILHSGTGHAWTEIWDEQANSWKTIDATPEKKDDDDKKSDQENQEQTEKTDIDAPPQEPRDDDKAPSNQEVEKKINDKQEETVETDRDASKAKDVSQSTRDKMRENMEKNQNVDDDSNNDELIDKKDWEEKEKEGEEMKKKHEEKMKKNEDMKKELKDADSFKDAEKLKEELEKADLYDEDKEKLENLLKDKEKQLIDDLKDQIEKMKDDGFIDEKRAEELLKKLEEKTDLTKMEENLSHENNLYNEYLEIREEVLPLVDAWYRYFADRLPKIEEVDHDEEENTRKGRFDRRSINRPRNLLFGLTQNPVVLSEQTVPRFMASVVLDISGSMQGKMRDARKLLIFFAELFEKISEEYGYIKSSLSVFNTNVELVKDFDYEYGSSKRYEYGDSERTVKVRLMEMTMARGGTDMGKALWQANKKLNEEKLKHPNYLSALYAISDGETSGELSGENLKRFLSGQQEFWGEWWGEHMKCGFLIGPESQKSVLSQYFGEENAESVPQINDLIEKVMYRFDEDSQNFIANLPQ